MKLMQKIVSITITIMICGHSMASEQTEADKKSEAAQYTDQQREIIKGLEDASSVSLTDRKKLLEDAIRIHGIHPRDLRINNDMALVSTVMNEDVKTAKLLLAHNADPNEKPKNSLISQFPIFFLAKTLPMAQLLVEHRADTNAIDFWGNNVLGSYSSISLNNELMAFYFAHGVNPCHRNNDGDTVLCARHNFLQTPLLVEMGVPIHNKIQYENLPMTFVQSLKVHIKLGIEKERSEELLTMLQLAWQKRRTVLKQGLACSNLPGNALQHILSYDDLEEFNQTTQEVCNDEFTLHLLCATILSKKIANFGKQNLSLTIRG